MAEDSVPERQLQTWAEGSCLQSRSGKCGSMRKEFQGQGKNSTQGRWNEPQGSQKARPGSWCHRPGWGCRRPWASGPALRASAPGVGEMGPRLMADRVLHNEAEQRESKQS